MTSSYSKISDAEEDSSVVDTLRLSEADIEEILGYLDNQQANTLGQNNRLHKRYPYRKAPGLILNISSPNGKHLKYKVVPRDISCSGLGLLIGTFVYPGTQAMVHVLTVSNGVRALTGKIIRCEHIRGRLHQVGMVFDEDIDLIELIGGRVGGEEAPRQVLTQLTGALLYVDNCIDDRELMRFYASQIGVRLTVTNNLLEAVDLVQSMSFDGVITSLELPDTKRDKISSSIRKAGYQKYLLGVTVAESDVSVDEGLMNGCDHVLIKPYTVDQLVELLAGFLPRTSPTVTSECSEPIRSTFWSNTPMRPIIVSYLSRLDEKRESLEGHLKQKIVERDALELIQEVKGSAASYGFSVLSESAQRVLDEASKGASQDVVLSLLETLCDQCRRACLAHAGGAEQT